MDYPTTQAAAEAIGSPYFKTGRPCLRGHDSPRYTKGGRCCHCARERNAKRDGRVFKPDMSRAERVLKRVRAAEKGEKQYVPLIPCKSGHMLRWTATNNCVECGRESRRRHLNSSKYARIKREYGLDREAYVALVEKQGSCCAICGLHEPDNFKLHVDHCHGSLKVRGLLCGRCNQALGLMGDSPETLRSAIAYLGSHEA